MMCELYFKKLQCWSVEDPGGLGWGWTRQGCGEGRRARGEGGSGDRWAGLVGGGVLASGLGDWVTEEGDSGGRSHLWFCCILNACMGGVQRPISCVRTRGHVNATASWPLWPGQPLPQAVSLLRVPSPHLPSTHPSLCPSVFL